MKVGKHFSSWSTSFQLGTFLIAVECGCGLRIDPPEITIGSFVE